MVLGEEMPLPTSASWIPHTAGGCLRADGVSPVQGSGRGHDRSQPNSRQAKGQSPPFSPVVLSRCPQIGWATLGGHLPDWVH